MSMQETDQEKGLRYAAQVGKKRERGKNEERSPSKETHF